jgi:glycolate oxidase FAD binding subunit
MADELGHAWRTAGVEHYLTFVDTDAAALWQRLAQFPQSGPAPLVLKASLVPSVVVEFASAVREIDAAASLQCHAGNGIVIARFAEFPASGLSRTLLHKLTPLAARCGGHVVILSNPQQQESTRASVWGGEAPFALMGEIKRQFDPRNILNPGRFVFP